MIKIRTKILNINGVKVVRLDNESSLKLSTRGVAMIEGNINGNEFKTVLEPDGNGSHWFEINPRLNVALNLNIGDSVSIDFSQSENWIEPDISKEWKTILQSNAQLNSIWNDITPLARWEWVRWMRSSKNKETILKRYEKAISLFKKGKRRPCCFNSNQCTVEEVSKGGILLK